MKLTYNDDTKLHSLVNNDNQYVIFNEIPWAGEWRELPGDKVLWTDEPEKPVVKAYTLFGVPIGVTKVEVLVGILNEHWNIEAGDAFTEVFDEEWKMNVWVHDESGDNANHYLLDLVVKPVEEESIEEAIVRRHVPTNH